MRRSRGQRRFHRGNRQKKSQPIRGGTLSSGGSLKYEATSAARGNRAQLSKFAWRNQEPALAEPGDATGVAGAGSGVCGAVVSVNACAIRPLRLARPLSRAVSHPGGCLIYEFATNTLTTQPLYFTHAFRHPPYPALRCAHGI